MLPISVVRPHLDPRWDAFIARAMARDPSARFASAQEMLTALDAIPESRGTGGERLGRLITELLAAPAPPAPSDPDAATAIETATRTQTPMAS